MTECEREWGTPGATTHCDDKIFHSLHSLNWKSQSGFQINTDKFYNLRTMYGW